ncbi:nonribosomal peptide synthetase [Zopfia rhizophila CBS 207.26]|uniref:Nonribosomal peptide synthetase n=1 Tax=Zopfia rhizophila CBS 207.26 TaxID=1314779 RepID=A0A6A6ERD0_9PEZI|nr:nonribosomal peptide synthetase [Zopfia rhizophila CBS 207.26]
MGNGALNKTAEIPTSHVDAVKIEIPIARDQELESNLDQLLAGWVLLLYRYGGDSFNHFAWGWKGTAESASFLQPITADQLNLGKWRTIFDVLYAVRSTRSREITYPLDSTLFINDSGPSDSDWNFQISIRFRDQTLEATSQWHQPSMAEYQATSQLYSFSRIMSEIIEVTGRSISPVLDISEMEKEILWSGNTPVPPTINRCMHDIVAEQAISHPDKLAVESWDGTLTYGQVEQYSTELAQNILLLSTNPHTIIPLLFEKSRWTVVAVLAVMKAGAAFALLDPAQPEGRLCTIVEQTFATVLITSKAQASLGAQIAPNATIIPISQAHFTKMYSPVASDQPKTSLPPVSPSSLLYIQFTSGSTGKPKGVMISHSNYTSGAIPRALEVGYASHSRVLDFASYAFDVSIDCMLATLSRGGTLCTPSEEKRINDLSGAIRDMNVNMAHMTPSVARVLDPDIMPQLEVLGLGGEAISPSDAASWGSKTKVVNAYGPSECTVGCTINNKVGQSGSYVTIGKGIGGTTWIVNPANHNQLVPIGAVGELLIEGPIVGIGYLNEPEKTKEVYIQDPEFLVKGSRMIPGRRAHLYKTGDLVRYDPDGKGEIVFVGRRDQQVKLRGQRIELAEIEYNMRKHLPSGTTVAVEVIKPGGAGEPTLVAFLVEEKQDGKTIPEDDVSSSFSAKFQQALNEMTVHISKDLPGYMVPAAYIPLHRMPLLVSCKTDRKRLREIGSLMSRQDLRRLSAVIVKRQEPTTKMERNIHQLWKKVLGSDVDFSTNDSFFSIGGDSLRAMKLVAAARVDDIALTVADIMTHPTLTAMAEKAQVISCPTETEVLPFSLIGSDWDAGTARTQAAEHCGLDPSMIEDVYPCTPLQEGLMALSAKFTDAYVAQRVLVLPNIDIAQKLQKAFERASLDCDILRTRIVNIPGHGLFQVVSKDPPPVHSGESLGEYLQQDRGDPMDLGKPLVRYGIIGTNFVLTIHHALYDGWSMPLVVDRVNHAYQGLETSRPASFKHFIKHLSNLDRPTSEAYWKQQLDGASGVQFPPLPYPGYITQADSLLEHYISVPQLPRTQHTLATAIRGAWAIVSSLYMGTSDMVYGETLTGRSAPVPGIEQIEGPMITTIPFRVKLDADTPVSELLQNIHNQVVQQLPHEHLGLQHIRRLSADAREACELRTGLVLHPKTDEAVGELPSIEEAPANGFVPKDDAEAAREALKFNTYTLMLVCTMDVNGFLVMASFDSQTITSEALEKVLRVFDRVVRKFCEEPETRVGKITVLSKEETKDAERIRPKGADSPMADDPAPFKKLRSNEQPALKAEDTVTDPKQRKLRQLWSRILGIDESDICPSDNFFQLGGDSIGAMKLVSEARLGNLKLTVAQVFKTRSLHAMADIAEDTQPAPERSQDLAPFAAFGTQSFDAAQIQPLLANQNWKIVDVYPTRPLQEIAVNATISLPRYSVRYELIHLNGHFDRQRLYTACQGLVARNEILRTVFVKHECRTLGVVLESLEVPIYDHCVTDGSIDSSVQEFCSLDIQRDQPYGSSFVEFTLFTNGRSCLAFRLSHAQYDEICLPVLLEQFSALYSGTATPETYPFSKFVSHVVLKDIPRCIPYWTNLLQGSSMSVLKPPIPLQSRNTASVYRDFDISSRPKNITIATLPTAAWAIALARRLGVTDVVFGEVVNGRSIDLTSTDKIIGPCWQYIPVRVKFEPEWTYLDLLEYVQNQHIESSSYEGMGLSEIVEKCIDWREEVNWFDTVVHQAPEGVEELEFGGLKARFETVYPHAEPLREWKVQVFVGEGRLRVEIVTFEAWKEVAEGLLGELEGIFERFGGERVGSMVGV